MLASSPSQHLESDLQPLVNPQRFMPVRNRSKHRCRSIRRQRRCRMLARPRRARLEPRAGETHARRPPHRWQPADEPRQRAGGSEGLADFGGILRRNRRVAVFREQPLPPAQDPQVQQNSRPGARSTAANLGDDWLWPEQGIASLRRIGYFTFAVASNLGRFCWNCFWGDEPDRMLHTFGIRRFRGRSAVSNSALHPVPDSRENSCGATTPRD